MSAVKPRENSDGAGALPRGLLPPYLVLRDVLDEPTVAGLLDHALSRQPEIAPTRVGSEAVNPAIRVSTGVRELGGYRQILKIKLLGLVPSLIAQLQVTPFENRKLETELVAHGDGAFYKRHIDTQTARHE